MMRSDMSTESRVKSLFSNRDFVGVVIRYTALLEFELDGLLAQYFLREDRIEVGISLLIRHLSFGDKVGTLAKLPIRKPLVSFRRAVVGLRRFQRIRNTAAHSWTISSAEVKRLLSGAEYNRRMLEDYPAGLDQEFMSTRDALERLSRVKDLRGPGGKRTVDSGMRLIVRALS